jgi:hypothetical protein
VWDEEKTISGDWTLGHHPVSKKAKARQFSHATSIVNPDTVLVNTTKRVEIGAVFSGPTPGKSRW